MKNIIAVLIITMFAISPAFAASGKPADGKMLFEILRDGKVVGTHALEFKTLTKTKTEVDIAINMLVKLGPIPVFRYAHKNKEIWDKNRPVSVKSTTNDDGELFDVSANWRSGVMMVSANGKEDQFLDSSIYPSSYWNPISLKASAFLNTQKGNEMPIKVKYLGIKDVDTAQGARPARTYLIDAYIPITINYDTRTQEWIGLSFKVRGSNLVYRRIDPI